MEISIISATMTKDDGYVGKVQFAVTGHRFEYEIVLHSKKGKEWGYGLFFLHQSGDEEQLEELEELLEDNDELFEQLVEAAKAAELR